MHYDARSYVRRVDVNGAAASLAKEEAAVLFQMADRVDLAD